MPRTKGTRQPSVRVTARFVRHLWLTHLMQFRQHRVVVDFLVEHPADTEALALAVASVMKSATFEKRLAALLSSEIKRQQPKSSAKPRARRKPNSRKSTASSLAAQRADLSYLQSYP